MDFCKRTPELKGKEAFSSPAAGRLAADWGEASDDYRVIAGELEDNWSWFVKNSFDVNQAGWSVLLREYLSGKFNCGD
jgi:hypothetical protein